MEALAPALLVALGVTGPALGVAWIYSAAAAGTSRNPDASGKILTVAIIGGALVELFGLAAVGLFFLL